jgi:hypothetical protein
MKFPELSGQQSLLPAALAPPPKTSISADRHASNTLLTLKWISIFHPM